MIIHFSVERVTSSKINKIKMNKHSFWFELNGSEVNHFLMREEMTGRKSDELQLTCSNSVKIAKMCNDN